MADHQDDAVVATSSWTHAEEVERAAKWFGCAGHFICGHNCRFHMATHVGPWLVSTVGENWPPRATREIFAESRDLNWFLKNSHRKGDDFDAAYMKRFGYEEVGFDRKYETMVFRAGEPCAAPDCKCGLPAIDGDNLDFAAYNDAGSATIGHRNLVKKWAARGETEGA